MTRCFSKAYDVFPNIADELQKRFYARELF